MPKYTILYILIGSVILGIIIYKLVTAKRDRRLKLLARVRGAYGVIPNREYSDTEMKKIRAYYEAVSKPDEFKVDDVTWNDLDMDSVFIAMNHTHSSVGEECLYDLLRHPSFDPEELKERDKLIRFFSENEETREKLSMEFAAVGRTKKYSLVQFLYQFRDLKINTYADAISNMVALGAAIVMLCIKPSAGIIVLVAVLLYNLISYYKNKGKLEAYYVSLQAMAYLVNASEMIQKVNDPVLEPYMDTLKKETSYISSLSKDMKWVGGNSVGSSSDLAQILMDYFRMMTHIDFLFFNRMVKRITNNEDHVLNVIHTMGYLESMIAIASYREMLPFFCTGEFTEEKRGIHIKDGYHPLLEEPVANSVTASGPLLLTGSNASGKSTFLRMCALSALLSQTVCTVHAKEYRAPFYRIYSSMALRDDLQSGDSYYIVEIRSMKRIMDALRAEGAPVLCFVDEVLRGTNTVERIAASSQILKALAESGAMTFAATHDIELTQLLEPLYENYHFTERVEDNAVYFSYKLLPGRATSRNAIKLLEIMGYQPEVVEAAQKEAEDFVETGNWSLV